MLKKKSKKDKMEDLAPQMLGVVKEKRTSLFYGVRVDKRVKNQVETNLV